MVDEAGGYHTAFLRPVLLSSQLVVYIPVATLSFLAYLKTRSEARQRFFAIFMFVISPIISCVLQIINPEMPYYSIGYLIGGVIVHEFVISNERETILLQQANNDALTGMYNRKAYESRLNTLDMDDNSEHLVIISMDLNGLKELNDMEGHAQGDLLLKNAAFVMKEVFGPYGDTYRVGGDEFVAIVHADYTRLQDIKKSFSDTIKECNSKSELKISIATGYAVMGEEKGISVRELSLLADKRMYQDKALFYQMKGQQRRNHKNSVYQIV